MLPFLSLYITTILGYTKMESGAILAFHGIGSLMGTYVGGYLTDRVGHYPVQLGSLFLSGLSFFMLMQLTSFYGLCAGLMVTSALTDSLRPANMSSIAEYSPPALRTRSIGLIRLAINLGFSAGPAIGGLIAFVLGYKWLFCVDGITCILAGFLFIYLIPRRSNIIQKEEEPTAEQSTFASPFEDKIYLLFILLVTLTGMVFMQYFYTVPVYFKENLGLNEKYVGYLLAANGILIALIELPLIHFIDKKYHPFKLLIVGVVLIGFAFAAFNGGYHIFFAWLSILFLSLGEILNFPFATTLVLNRSPQKGRGRYMGLYSMSYSFCNVIAPILGFAIAARYGFSALWFMGAIVCLAVGYGLIYLKPHFRVSHA